MQLPTVENSADLTLAFCIKEHIGLKGTSNVAQLGSLRKHRNFAGGQGLGEPVFSLLLQKGERKLTFLEVSFQDMRRVSPGCLGKAPSHMDLLLWVSKLFLLEICGSPPALPGSGVWWRITVLFPSAVLGVTARRFRGQATVQQRAGSEAHEINHSFPSVWTGYDPDSSLPKEPFLKLFKPCVYFMGNFTRLFLIHFQLKTQNTGFVRAL